MSKFLKHSISFIIFLTISLIAGELLIRNSPNPYKTKDRIMQEQGEEIQTLVLGSSHSYFGVNPKYLDGHAFSLANVSQNYKFDYYLLTRYANKYKNLKSVIVPVSYHSFNALPYEVNPEGRRFITNYRLYMGYTDCGWDIKYNAELNDLVLYGGKILSAFKGTLPDCSDFGFNLNNKFSQKNEGAEITTAKEAAIRHTKSNQYENYNLKYLADIIRFCKERSVNVILITTPTYHTYYDLIDKSEQLARMYAIIDSLKVEYDLTYFDYLKDHRFETDDFIDADHLDDVGAAKFTKILNKDMRMIQYRQ